MTGTKECNLASILIGAQAGEQASREALAASLMSELIPLVARAARDAPGAEFEDVRQDVFLLLVEPKIRFDPERGTARGYIFNAARSAADFGGCRRARDRRSDQELEEIFEQCPVESLVEVHDELAAARALNGLLFDLVVSIELDGMTAKALAARLGVPPSKICRQLQKFSAKCNQVLRLMAA